MKFAVPFCVFAAMSVFLAQGIRQDPRQIPSVLVDKPAPAFRLAELQNPARTFGPKDMLGKVWVLNVWASWCVSCRAEHAVLTDLARTSTVPVYGLDYKDEREAALTFLQTFGNPYAATVQDPDGRVGIDYGVYGVPETYVIDAKGVIRYKQIGPLTSELVERVVAPLIGRLSR
jgi:cytochrome c biogenesis protein CcmG, thiol:disulfide interchange protein DsbE